MIHYTFTILSKDQFESQKHLIQNINNIVWDKGHERCIVPGHIFNDSMKNIEGERDYVLLEIEKYLEDIGWYV